MRQVSINQRRYVLQDRDGDYVSNVKSTGMETVKLHFEFTPELEKAKRFTYEDLWWKLATTCIGIHFMQGYSGGQAIEVSRVNRL